MNYLDPTFQDDLAQVCQALKKERPKLEGKTVLITGGSGFLGTYLIGTLLYLNEHYFKTKCKIISLDNHITSHGDSFKKNRSLRYITHDVKLPFKTNERIDYIVHAAGIASPIYYKKFPLKTIDVAITGTRNMLDLALKKKVSGFLFFSSSEIYGDPDQANIPTKETYRGNVSSIGPRSCYDESKRMGEALSITYYEQFNLPIKIVRPFNVYGPGMNHNDYRVIPNFIFQALMGNSLPIHDDGRQTRAFCYISDAITGFFKILLADAKGEVYNIGNDEAEVSMNTLAKVVDDAFSRPLDLQNVQYPKDYPQDEPRRRCPDLSKAKTDLEYLPKVDLKTGLLRTVKWCQNNWEIK